MHVSRNLAVCWTSPGQYFFAKNNLISFDPFKIKVRRPNPIHPCLIGDRIKKFTPKQAVKFRGRDEISSYLYNVKNSLYLKNPISIRFRWDKCSRTDFFRHTFHRIRNHFQNFLSTRFRQISFWKFFFKIFMEYPYQPSPRWETSLDQWGRLVGGLLVGRRYKGLNFLIIIRVCQSVFWFLISVFFH